MTGAAAELANEVRRAVEDQPYTVVDETPEGFSMHVDVVDAQWWSLFRRNGLRQTWRWDVEVEDGRYSVTDQMAALEWQAGAGVSGGVPRPVLRFQASLFRGSAVSISKRQTWALDDEGRFAAVVSYSFDSREGRAIIDAVAQRQGLKKKMNTSAKTGLFVAVFAVIGTALGGLWVLVLALTGNLS